MTFHPLNFRFPFLNCLVSYFSCIYFSLFPFYRPQTKLRKGDGFTPVCQSFCSQRGHAWQGACVARGIRGRGVCVVGAACVVGGHVWQGGMCGRGACVAGGMCGRGACMPGGVRGRTDGHCSGRYASYWNAFLWINVLTIST